ncbi:MAG: PIN domain-containing protein [Anaerolineae bacterium]|nr:PIN domain-containing protein [Anaerolineae bacterium]
MVDEYLLDTSAVLTLIEDEAGADRVEELLRYHTVLIPWIALLEVFYITQQERGATEAERRFALIKALPATQLWTIDEPTLLQAGRLKAAYRLSLADTIVAALAQQHGAILVHKDPEYDTLQGQLRLEALPYKASPR